MAVQISIRENRRVPIARNTAAASEQDDNVHCRSEVRCVDQRPADAIDPISERIEAGQDRERRGRLASGKSAPDRKKIGITRKFMIS